jgi:hypothetical protein
VFAGSGDNSYAGFLRQFVSNPTQPSPSLILIKSFEFARDLQPLADKLETVSFPELFRETKIPSARRISNGDFTKTPNTIAAPFPAWATTAKPVTPSVNGTAAAMGALSLKSTNRAAIPIPTSLVWVNVDGHRIDKPIPNVDRELALKLKKKKLCNRHHLRGDCDGFYCGHSHEGKLNDEEKRALRFVARSRPCQRGVWCEDADCVDGHRCAFADSCRNENCWFSEEMHHSTEGAKEKRLDSYVVVS